MAEATGASVTSPAHMKRATDIRQVSAALSARFEVLEPLGVSETMALYLARDKKNPELLVTLKLIRGETLRDPKQLELFYLEAEAASRLKHRNIVRASKATSSDGLHFMAIEHRGGVETLRSLLDRKGWLEPDLVVKIVCQIADALNYAHGLGILHMNLHPENILIDRDGNVLVTGFGIEDDEELDWAHRERSCRMRARYMSPEQAKGDRAHHSSDLYSLGVMLFEMLTDRLPFNAANTEVIKRKHITQSPLPPYIFSPGISRPLSDITMKLLEKKPGSRFQNGSSLVSILSKLYDVSLPVKEEPANYFVTNGHLAEVESQSSGKLQDALEEPEAEAAPDTRPGDETWDEPAAIPIKEASHTEALAEEEAPPAPDYVEPAPRAAESKGAYEPPAISTINHPVRQFYESASSHEAVSRPSVPFIKDDAAPASAPRRRRGWLGALVIAALIIAAAGIVLARGNYLKNIFRFGVSENTPAKSLQSEPTAQPPAPSGDAPSQPRPQEEPAPAGQAGSPVASQSAASVAPRVQKSQVRKSPRRSKSKPKRNRNYRRTWF